MAIFKGLANISKYTNDDVTPLTLGFVLCLLFVPFTNKENYIVKCDFDVVYKHTCLFRHYGNKLPCFTYLNLWNSDVTAVVVSHWLRQMNQRLAGWHWLVSSNTQRAENTLQGV